MEPKAGTVEPSVEVKLQVDQKGDGQWLNLQTIKVSVDKGAHYIFPKEFSGIWLRMVTDRNCRALAFLHQTTSRYPDGSIEENRALFDGLADIEDQEVFSTLHYPAKHNRNLRVIAKGKRYDGGEKFLEFTKNRFEFESVKSDEKLKALLKVKTDFSVDAASVIIKHGKQLLRLPKGHDRYSQPFEGGWPRGLREVISERGLANLHGTFYEIPLITNGNPPA